MSSGSTAARVVRPIVEDERAAFWDVITMAFNEPENTEARDDFLDALGLDRTFAAFEDDELVGCGGAFRFRMTVPGLETVRTAGLTAIAVKPTARRRGVLSSMLRKHFDDLHAAGDEPLAVLQASEPQIYGRFGYGLATTGIALRIPRSPNALRPVPGVDKYRLRLVDAETGYQVYLGLYAEAAKARPGMMAREDGWKGEILADHHVARGGYGPQRWLIAEGPDGVPAGAATYRTKESEQVFGRPGGKVKVGEVYGRDLAAYAALWRYLLDLDLTDEVHTHGRPTDDPLLRLLHNSRAAQPMVRDHIYARLVDVDKALSARRYSVPVDVVFDVSDPFCPWNTGRYRLAGDETGAECVRTTDAPDLVLNQHELGSVYLGGVGLAALGRAGLVEELTPGALRVASLAFLSDPAPWMPYGF